MKPDYMKRPIYRSTLTLFVYISPSNLGTCREARKLNYDMSVHEIARRENSPILMGSVGLLYFSIFLTNVRLVSDLYANTLVLSRYYLSQLVIREVLLCCKAFIVYLAI